MALAAGARLGPYELVAPLGSGGMGEVYRARDTRLGREVAVKVLPSHTADSPDGLARFEFEARTVAGLNHPNILALHDVGVQTGVSYAVTELLEGETLRDRLVREGRLAPGKTLELAVQFARGLAAAHGRGIVHRDLKPENLFLTTEGRLKILDFGLAVRDAASPAASAADTRLATEAGILLGTVQYMAPEQARGETVSTRADVFSFGLVVYELLTGSNPFARGTTAETMAAILRDQPEPLSAVQDLPPLAARLIERCLEKRPEDRPASMHDVAWMLDAAVAAPAGLPDGIRAPEVNLRRIAAWGLAAAGTMMILLTLAMAVYVAASADRAAGAAVAAELARADTMVLRAHQDRLERLQLHARLIASFPQLKALFDLDAPTIRDHLQGYQQQNPGTPLLVALGLGGHVLARTDADLGTAPESGQQWLAALLSSGGTGVISIDGRPYHAALAHAEAGGTVFGSVLAAAPVDDGFAQVLREATQEEIVLFDGRGMTGTSLRSGRVPWRSLDAFRTEADPAGRDLDVTVGEARFTAREIRLADEPPLVAVILASRDGLTAPYRGIQTGLLTIGVIAATLVLVAGGLALRRWAPGTALKAPYCL